MRAIILIPICAMFLAGCIRIETDVIRFHQSLDLNAGKTFIIHPRTEQKNNLEFQAVSTYVSGKLQTYGLKPVNSKSTDVNYGVQFYYGISDGKTVGYSQGEIGSDISNQIVYTRYFNLEIFDLKNNQTDMPKKIFEGSVKSTGSLNSLAIVRRCLIDAMFTDFPGVSGNPQKLRLEFGKCKV